MNSIIRGGHFIDGSDKFRIGKYKGEYIEDVYDKDENYVKWVFHNTTDEYDQDVLASLIMGT